LRGRISVLTLTVVIVTLFHSYLHHHRSSQLLTCVYSTHPWPHPHWTTSVGIRLLPVLAQPTNSPLSSVQPIPLSFLFVNHVFYQPGEGKLCTLQCLHTFDLANLTTHQIPHPLPTIPTSMGSSLVKGRIDCSKTWTRRFWTNLLPFLRVPILCSQ
jgi:hypothetical protein